MIYVMDIGKLWSITGAKLKYEHTNKQIKSVILVPEGLMIARRNSIKYKRK